MSSSKKSLLDLHPHRWDIPAMTLLSSVMLGFGFALPVLTVRKLWEENTFSIWTGIVNMWGSKEHFLAAVIFFFSIIFPVAKLILLFVTWFMRLSGGDRKQLLGFLGVLGKWSMLDVFVTAVMLVWLKLGALADARAEEGIYFFAVSILLAMAVTNFQLKLAKIKD